MKAPLLVLVITVVTIGAFTALADSSTPFLKKISSGNLSDLDKAFARLARSDGGDAEALDIAIGKSIIRHPKNFIIALKKHRSKVVRLDAVLGNLGDEYVDQMEEQKNELKKRLLAIKSISDKALKKTVAECVTELENQISSRANKK